MASAATAGRLGDRALLLRRREAMAVLGISAPTLDRIVESGELPIVRLRPGCRAVRFESAAILAFIKRRTERRHAATP